MEPLPEFPSFAPAPVPSRAAEGAARQPRVSGTLAWLLTLLATLVLLSLLPWFVEQLSYAFARGRERAEVASARGQLAEHKLAGIQNSFEQIAKVIGPSVVHINTTQLVRTTPSRGGLEQFFDERDFEAVGEGSGVIIDSDGYILTNNHVVQGVNEIEVVLSDGRKLAGTVMGADPATDMAVVKVSASGLQAAEWGDSEALKVGDLVWAVGNPYGLDRSITFGIISAKGRRGISDSPFLDFLQTDAAVNPGNSGGPLVDIEGKVVGINTAIVGKAFRGITFSIPSSTAREVFEHLRKTGKVVRGWLGVELRDVTAADAKKLKLPDTRGALVGTVLPDSPAEAAGIEPRDVIVQWNHHPIDDADTLKLLVARSEVNSRVAITIIRDGEETTLDARLEARPTTVRLRPR